MQKRIYLIAVVIGAILSVQSVNAQSREQKLQQQIQRKRQDIADMQRKLEVQRQQRSVERIPPAPVTRNTNANADGKPGEGVSNANGSSQAHAVTSARETKSRATKKEPVKHEAP